MDDSMYKLNPHWLKVGWNRKRRDSKVHHEQRKWKKTVSLQRQNLYVTAEEPTIA